MPKTIGSFSFHNEANLLISQLECMQYFCDEIVLLSDNATQDALEVANSYINNKNIFLLSINKRDNFYERDEYGDRQKLLEFAKSRNAEIHYHTDADEIPLIKDIPKIYNIINNVKDNEIHKFELNTFWGNAHNYRIPYQTNIHAGQIIKNIKSGSVMPYVYHLKYAGNFTNMMRPNFHAPRTPNFHINMNEVTHDIIMLHYGYFTPNIIENKNKFYNQNKNITGNCWGEDMQVNTQQYIDKWGMGEIQRK